MEPPKHRPYRGRRETYSPTCGKTTISRTGERTRNARQYEAATSEDGEDPQGHTSDLLGRTLASEKNTGNEARRTDPLKGQPHQQKAKPKSTYLRRSESPDRTEEAVSQVLRFHSRNRGAGRPKKPLRSCTARNPGSHSKRRRPSLLEEEPENL